MRKTSRFAGLIVRREIPVDGLVEGGRWRECDCPIGSVVMIGACYNRGMMSVILTRIRICVVWVCLCGMAAVGCAGKTGKTDARYGTESPHEMTAAPITIQAGESQRLVRDAGRSNGVRVVNLAFQVYRFDLPLLGDMRHSLKLWNHVDELRTDPEKVAMLARSGIRAGVFSDDAWRPLRVILDAADARTHQEQIRVQAGMPLVLEVGKVDEYESVFSYAGGGRLVGKTFEDGKKLLNIGYALYADTGGRLDIEVSFEIRHDRGEMTFERAGGTVRQVPAYDSHVFHELTALMMLNPGESLLIGPSAEAGNANLVGGSFLGRMRGGNAFETLFVVKPIPYEASSVAAG